VYVVSSRGFTNTEPDTASPVLKLTPELLLEFLHDQGSTTDPPSFIIILFCPEDAVAPETPPPDPSPELKLEKASVFELEMPEKSGGVHCPGLCANDGHDAGTITPPPLPFGDMSVIPSSIDFSETTTRLKLS
jgi:hypothetical protein